MPHYDEGFLDGYRAAQKEELQVVVVHDVKLDCVAQEVDVQGRKAHLSTSEAAVLGTLMRSPRVVTKERLISSLYPLPTDEPAEVDNIIRVFVFNIRRKLDSLGVDRRFIVSHHGVGYQVPG